jgi:hypothetical protein
VTITSPEKKDESNHLLNHYTLAYICTYINM